MAKVVDIKTKKNVPQKEEIENRRGLKKFLCFVCVACFIGAWGLIIIDQGGTLAAQKDKQQELNESLEKAKENVEDKKNRLENSGDLSYIEKIARDKLKYIKENETVLIPVEPAE